MQNILIVEDLTPTRDWLQRLCETAFTGADIRTASNIFRARQLVEDGVIDLAVLDLELPDGRGLELIAPIKQASPDAICVIATVSGDNANVVAALAAGADGYLLKEQDDALLTVLLKQISVGIPPLSPEIAQRLISHFKNTGPLNSTHDLTPREAEVLGMIGLGLRNAEVAKALGISTATVAGYIKSIYRKLGISTRAEAAWRSRQLGL